MAETAEYKPGDLPYAEQDDRKLFCKFHYKGVLILVIPLIFAPILLAENLLVSRFIYLTICLYLYYILNVMAQGATAFIYITFVPVLGIAGSGPVSNSYYTDLIFLTYGSVIMGVMMDTSKLGDRLGILVIKICGSNIRILQIFLVIVTAVSSIFVNSTVMAAFWMKVAIAVMTEFNDAGIAKMYSDEEPYERGSKPYPSRPAVGIYLTVCYASTLGAMISPLQDPNDALIDIFNMNLNGKVGAESFLVLLIVPMILSMIVLIVWINIMFLGLAGGSVKQELAEGAGNKDGLKQAMVDKQEKMGPWTIHTKLSLALVLLTFLMMMTRKPRFMDGWDTISEVTSNGPSVAIIGMSILFFGVPANYMFCKYYMCRQPKKEGSVPSLLGWKAVNSNTPWGHIFMLGAGFSCVFSGKHAGFFDYLVDSAVKSKMGNGTAMVYGSALGTILTILSPATTLAKLAVPIMFGAGKKLAVPFAAALHNQFMLPTSTPSNTIIAGWGNVRPYQFLLGGLVPTIFMFILILGFTMALGGTAFSGY
ncbi:protein I'm not dead yet [Drosophila obscura]|uniref:protein I'm not dead yet n=1 Tax=Drosophila obscura TaxID=7282 RepID=UPI000BA05C25|nr:protein I'm not dead yet [Drosophila obscura]